MTSANEIDALGTLGVVVVKGHPTAGERIALAAALVCLAGQFLAKPARVRGAWVNGIGGWRAGRLPNWRPAGPSASARGWMGVDGQDF